MDKNSLAHTRWEGKYQRWLWGDYFKSVRLENASAYTGGRCGIGNIILLLWSVKSGQIGERVKDCHIVYWGKT